MAIVQSYPLFTVAHLTDSRAFFVREFGMHVVFEASWIVMLSHSAEGAIQLGLMASDHPSAPPGPEVFEGKGMILTIQVDDAALLHARCVREGGSVVHPLSHEPWGQRRFMVRDPSGILVDVVEQVAPEPGFWERYT
jgi:uncharacterized glyoxalase superfamily protein PhnB